MTNPSPVRLGEDHGYRLDGDTVHLHASFLLEEPVADLGSHSLQLWACPEIPADVTGWQGCLIAETPLPPFSQLLGDPKTFAGVSFVTPPAGRNFHFMVLALSAGADAPVVDFKAFGSTQAFMQPSMTGRVEIQRIGDQVRCEVEKIENPRDASTSSGTLSLELWALSQPYSGGLFQGFPLAGVSLDAVPGQSSRDGVVLEFAELEPLAEGTQAVLMLREWTPVGYVTRDFVTLDGNAACFRPTPSVAVEETPAEPTPAPVKEPVAPAEAPPAPAAEPETQGAALSGLTPSPEEEIIAPESVAPLPPIVEPEAQGAALAGLTPFPVEEAIAPEAVAPLPPAPAPEPKKAPVAEPAPAPVANPIAKPEPSPAPPVAKPEPESPQVANPSPARTPVVTTPSPASPSGFSPTILSPTRAPQPGLLARLKAWLKL